jgi:hypothetical protein
MAAALLLVPAAARADTGGVGGPCSNSCSTSAGTLINGELQVLGGITLTSTAPVRPGAGTLATDGDAAPPACWYQPGLSPAAADAVAKGVLALVATNAALLAVARSWLADPLTDPHLGRSGLWYHEACTDPGSRAAAAWLAVTGRQLLLWVPPGTVPVVPGAAVMTPDRLAAYAVDSVTLPATSIARNPAGPATVNLATWIWLSEAAYPPVSVSAVAGPVTVTAIARPAALTLPTGVPDTALTPPDGVCTALFDAYTGNPAAPPACAITFGRASVQDPDGYPVTVRLQWGATWSASTGAGGALPVAALPGTVRIPVQELQSIITR